jgi:hypothetical protein
MRDIFMRSRGEGESFQVQHAANCETLMLLVRSHCSKSTPKQLD